jgi:mono/diheme cytochrome c family protein
MRFRFRSLAAVFFLLVLAGVAGAAIWTLRAGGFSTRDEPRPLERLMARAARRWAVPAAARDAVNPIAFTPEVWSEARAHFADHCASCHGNDGAGQTELGGTLSAGPTCASRSAEPDRRRDLTGSSQTASGSRMPAWGPGGPDDRDTWMLVHFIRRLKDLTPADLKAMHALNPKSPAELEEERADEQFLAGETPEASSPNPHHHD